MASLQAKHSRNCAQGRAWTSFGAAQDGCTCPQGPLYYVVVRDDGRADKIPAGRNRREAERALRKIAVSVDDGEYQPQLNVGFAEWADRWLASLERKPTTVRSYRPTMTYAKELFRRKPVRRLRPEDIAAFNQVLRERGVSPSTRAKHLRVLGACLQSALRHGYAARNPVRDLPPAERPRPERKEAAYFQNAELPRLFAEFPEGMVKTLFLLALKTGMRQGELLGVGCINTISLQIGRIQSTTEFAHPRVMSGEGFYECQAGMGVRSMAALLVAEEPQAGTWSSQVRSDRKAVEGRLSTAT